MKANPRTAPRRPVFPAALGLALLASACVPPPPAPTPRPSAAPQPVAPAPAATTPADWRDAPLTPGDWAWTRTTDGATATFAGGQFALHCNLSQHSVSIMRAAGGGSGAASLAITTSQSSRALAATLSGGALVATLPARDPLLDAMAFSRGRFVVAATGTAPLYVPSWTEVSRVVEDCR